jgi:histone deacetylase 6
MCPSIRFLPDAYYCYMAIKLTAQGGYNLQAISDSALAVGQVLLGEPPAELPALQASEVATEVIHQVAKIQSEHWESIDVKACEPPEVADTDEFTVRTPIPGQL